MIAHQTGTKSPKRLSIIRKEKLIHQVFTHEKGTVTLDGKVGVNIIPLDRHAKFPPFSEVTIEVVDELISRTLKPRSGAKHLIKLLDSISRLPKRRITCSCGHKCQEETAKEKAVANAAAGYLPDEFYRPSDWPASPSVSWLAGLKTSPAKR